MIEYSSLFNYNSNYVSQIKRFELWKTDHSILPLLATKDRCKGVTQQWGRVICKWQEAGQNHQFASRIDLLTGNLYFDCSPQKLLLKAALHTLYRPIYCVMQIILEVVGLLIFRPLECLAGLSTFKEFLQYEWEHVKLIGKLPLISSVQTVITGLGVLSASATFIFSRQHSFSLIYNSTMHTGNLELYLHKGMNHYSRHGLSGYLWHQNKYFQNLTHCFMPYGNIQETHKSLDLFPRKILDLWQSHRYLWNGLQRMPVNKDYVSPVLNS